MKTHQQSGKNPKKKKQLERRLQHGITPLKSPLTLCVTMRAFLEKFILYNFYTSVR